MDWKNGYFVKLYRSQSPDWLALPVLTRGLFAELMLLADRVGRIQLGRAGVASVAIPLRATDATIGDVMQHVQRLLDDGCIYVDGDALVIRNFVDAQSRALTSTERSQRLREEGKAPGKSSKGKGKRPVQRDATDATIGGTDATQRNGCNDKEQTEQNKQIRTEAAEQPRAAAAKVNPSEQAVLDALAPWSIFAPLADLDWVRATKATAGTRGWSDADITTGIAEAGEKKSGAFAVTGVPDTAVLSDIVTGFIKTAHAKRRAGATATPGTGGYPGHPRPAEAPSVASQKPFHVAPRSAS